MKLMTTRVADILIVGGGVAGLSECSRLPVCPLAHYHMGGVALDIRGRTSVSGL